MKTRFNSSAARSIITAAILTLIAGCASSSEPSRRPSMGMPPGERPTAILSSDALVLVSFDEDRDYRVTSDELDRGITLEFQSAAQASESLTPVAFQSWAERALGGLAMGPGRLQFDRNMDGLVSREEFRNEFAARFNRYDLDRDGVLNRKEMQFPLPAMPTGRMPRPPAGMPPMGPGGGPMGGGGGMPPF